MTKITKLTLLFVCIFSSVSFAQLSVRESKPSTYQTGTRPIAGNMAFYLGLDGKSVAELLKKKDEEENLVAKKSFPLVNVKYYIDNSTVFRIGLAATKDKSVFSGKSTADTMAASLDEGKSKTVTSEYLLIPAIEKHFNTNNFFDPYVGVQALVGWVKDNRDSSYTRVNGDKYSEKMRGNSPVYGLGGFIGLQAFVADLPLAIGFEYGIVGKGYLNNKYTTETEATTGGVTIKDTNVSPANSTYAANFDKASGREFQINNVVRVTINYFFSR